MSKAIFYMVHSRIHVSVCEYHGFIGFKYILGATQLPSGFLNVKLSLGKVQHMLMLTMNEN